MQAEGPVLFKVGEEWRTAKCSQCLHEHLGDRVDL